MLVMLAAEFALGGTCLPAGVPMFLVKLFWPSGPCPLSLLVNFGAV
jgi:hypothetical protein